MGKRCVVCKKLQGKDNRTYHRFPKYGHSQSMWLMSLAMPKENLRYTTYICSDHFLPSDFQIKPGGKTWLKRDAVPIGPSPSQVIPSFSGGDPINHCKKENTLPSTKERLEFLTVVEDTDDTATGSLDEQEHPKKRVRFGPSPVTVQTIEEIERDMRNEESRTTNYNNFIHNIPNGRPASSQLVETTVNSNMSCHNLPSTSARFICDNSGAGENEPSTITAHSSKTKSSNQTSLNGTSDLSDVSDGEISDDSSDVSTSSISTAGSRINKVDLIKIKRTKALLRRFLNCSDNAYNSNKAKKCWHVAKTTITELKGRIGLLQCQNRRLRHRIEYHKSLFRYLKQNNLLNEYAEVVLKAVMSGSVAKSLS